jgi:hypothetical protein
MNISLCNDLHISWELSASKEPKKCDIVSTLVCLTVPRKEDLHQDEISRMHSAPSCGQDTCGCWGGILCGKAQLWAWPCSGFGNSTEFPRHSWEDVLSSVCSKGDNKKWVKVCYSCHGRCRRSSGSRSHKTKLGISKSKQECKKKQPEKLRPVQQFHTADPVSTREAQLSVTQGSRSAAHLHTCMHAHTAAISEVSPSGTHGTWISHTCTKGDKEACLSYTGGAGLRGCGLEDLLE